MTDVLVIGGGPAGLAAAIAARLKGLSVTVADGAHPPIDKACGEGLMPDGLAALRQLGVALHDSDGFAFRGVRFINEGMALETPFPGGGSATGLGVRRPVLQQRMVERAASLGVNFLWDTPVVGLHHGSAVLASGGAGHRAVKEIVFRARWIIGADGSSSRVRRWSGLERSSQKESRFAFRRHYRITPWSDCAQIYWGRRAQAYVTPVSAEEVCVVAIARHHSQRSQKLLSEFPDLLHHLARARAVSSERGAVTSMHRLTRVTRGNVALLGDASGSVDAITGEGLCLGFRQAAALAAALEHENLAQYQRAHRRLTRRPTFMARAMLALDARPALRRRVLRVFSADPTIFSRVLALHVGAASPMHAALTTALFGWRFAAV